MAPEPRREKSLPIDRSTLDGLLIRAVGWTAAVKWSSQVVSWGSLLLLARILSPSDFGILSMTFLLIGFINIFAEFGFGSAIVVMRELSRHQIRQMHVLSVLLAVAAFAAASLAAKPAAAFFGRSELTAVIPVLGAGFILAGFRVVPLAVLTRDLEFKKISAIEALTTVANALGCLAFAWLGFRYWALVIGDLAGSAVATALFLAMSPCGFSRPVPEQLRGQLGYSQRLLISRIASYLYSRADFAVAGRVLGGAALGVYSMAWNVANAPVDRIATLVLRATPPVFSHVQYDLAELRRYLRVVTEGIALIVFPAGFGMAVVAGTAVSALLDARWAGAATPLRLLAIAAVFRCVVSVASQVQTTIRDVGYSMRVSLISLCVLPPSFWLASRWGADGIAAVWLCACPVLSSAPLFRTLRKIGLSKREYFATFRPAGAAAAAMAGSVLAVQHSLGDMRPLIALILECAAGAAVYLGVLAIFFRKRVEAFGELVFRRRSAEQAEALLPGHRKEGR